MEKAFADVKGRIGQGPMADFAARLLSQYQDLADGFLDRAGEIGPRAAMLELLQTVGVDEGKRAKLMTGELSNLSFVQSQVRFVARNFLNATGDEEQSLVRTIKPTDCPGSWLEWALRSRVRTASADPQPNHLSDAERLAYLPYVDLLITDREMTELTNQIRKDWSTPDQVRIARAPQAVSSSLAALQNALDLAYDNG